MYELSETIEIGYSVLEYKFLITSYPESVKGEPNEQKTITVVVEYKKA